MDTKISPAFEPFLAESGPHDKREAIVIYDSPVLDNYRVRGRLRTLRQRLDKVKARAKAQRPLQAKLLSDYRRAGAKQFRRKTELITAPIGDTVLPIATVEITRKTLPVLAEQRNVLAVLPNQKIHLIKPKEVDYEELAKQENTDKITWGLKKLSIPEFWSTSKGRDINVAVLDTGVHADHPALTGRVEDFIVIDPLGRRITATPPFDAGEQGPMSAEPSPVVRQPKGSPSA